MVYINLFNYIMSDILVDLSVVFSDVCKFGLRCPDQKCGLFHPSGWNWRRNVVCPQKDSCRKWSCQHCHARGHVPIDRKSCVSGVRCPNRLCADKHPVEWDWQKNTECSEQYCFTKNCPFMHSSKQNTHVCTMCCLQKENAYQRHGYIYCSEDCYDDHIQRQIEDYKDRKYERYEGRNRGRGYW